MDISSQGARDILLRLHQVMAVSGKSRASIYRGIKNGQFPRQVKITSRAAGWSRKEIEAWIEERKWARDDD